MKNDLEYIYSFVLHLLPWAWHCPTTYLNCVICIHSYFKTSYEKVLNQQGLMEDYEAYRPRINNPWKRPRRVVFFSITYMRQVYSTLDRRFGLLWTDVLATSPTSALTPDFSKPIVRMPYVWMQTSGINVTTPETTIFVSLTATICAHLLETSTTSKGSRFTVTNMVCTSIAKNYGRFRFRCFFGFTHFRPLYFL